MDFPPVSLAQLRSGIPFLTRYEAYSGCSIYSYKLQRSRSIRRGKCGCGRECTGVCD